MNYEWKLIFIWPVETVWQNGLQKRTFVLEEVSDKDYKGSIAIDLIKDKVNMINEYKVGDVVSVWLNFRANYSENSKKYYNGVNAWNIKAVKTGYGHAFPEDDWDLPF